MTDIVDDMIEYKWYRVEQNVVRFADSRFGRKHDGNYRYNEPDADGFIPLLGAADDVCVGYTHVTNAAFAQFAPSHPFPLGSEGHPVVNVSYEDAVAYCEWLTENSPGHAYKYRLPTQEEWELAAGHMPKDAAINAADFESSTTDVYYYYSIYTNGAQSLSGCLDMWGNAWEWLATPHTNGQMKIRCWIRCSLRRMRSKSSRAHDLKLPMSECVSTIFMRRPSAARLKMPMFRHKRCFIPCRFYGLKSYRTMSPGRGNWCQSRPAHPISIGQCLCGPSIEKNAPLPLFQQRQTTP